MPPVSAAAQARRAAPRAQGLSRNWNKCLVLKGSKLWGNFICYDLCIRHSNHLK